MPTLAFIDLTFPLQALKPSLLISLLSVWVLIGVCFYLNRYTRRPYFALWTAGWVCYSIWLVLGLAQLSGGPTRAGALGQQCAVGTAAVFLLWGSAQCLGSRLPARAFGLMIAFLVLWSYVSATVVPRSLPVDAGIFGVISLASLTVAWSFYQFGLRQQMLGAGLLATGFALWAVYLAAFPVLQGAVELLSAAFFIAALLQLFIAVSMIVLVLEEARRCNEVTARRLRSEQSKTERLRDEARSTEARYRNLFEQASEGIVIADAATLEVLDLNPEARRLLGLLPGAKPAKPFHAYFQDSPPAVPACSQADSPTSGRPPERDQQRARDDAPPADGAGRLTPDAPPLAPSPQPPGAAWFEWIEQHPYGRLLRADGRSLLLEVNGAAVRYAERPAYQFFLRELTERYRLEQQLRQAEKLSALGQMISGVAHELNNPLTVLTGYLELILERHRLPDPTRADLEKVAREAHRAAELVNNFLTFAQQQPLARRRVNLNDCVRQALQKRKFEFLVMGIGLGLELEEPLRPVLADAGQIEQAMLHLINNALHAMADLPGPGRLTIRTRSSERSVTVEFEDTGAGVPEELASRIFEPFFTTKEVGTGTGLGLALCHSIMIEHQGRITYERAPAGGALFRLEFPALAPAPEPGRLVPCGVAAPSAALSQPPPPARTTRGQSQEGQRGEATRRETEDEAPRHPTSDFGSRPSASAPLAPGPTMRSRPAQILILDDEKAIAEMLAEMLSLLGHTPTLCHSAPDALELIQKHDFDLVLSDVRMPVMDGQRFYQELRRRHPATAERVVFLTGDTVNREVRSFLDSTGNRHLCKPFRLSAVEDVIDQTLRRGRAPVPA
jgi:signal transduction histidine kinase/ActR/RegA family two-component response regulator